MTAQSADTSIPGMVRLNEREAYVWDCAEYFVKGLCDGGWRGVRRAF